MHGSLVIQGFGRHDSPHHWYRTVIQLDGDSTAAFDTRAVRDPARDSEWAGHCALVQRLLGEADAIRRTCRVLVTLYRSSDKSV